MREGRVATTNHELHTAPGYPVTAEPEHAVTERAVPAEPRSRWTRFFSRRSA
jgi:hypothetical protein